MKIKEDHRLGFARRLWLISWLFYGVFVVVISIVAYSGQMTPYMFGLPAWLVKAEFFVPVIFIVALIILIEKLVPNIDLEK
jgi:uncharacterized membrane protein YhdT